jgi:hypothetical protein
MADDAACSLQIFDLLVSSVASLASGDSLDTLASVAA